jgi:hypothetical protein
MPIDPKKLADVLKNIMLTRDDPVNESNNKGVSPKELSNPNLFIVPTENQSLSTVRNKNQNSGGDDYRKEFKNKPPTGWKHGIDVWNEIVESEALKKDQTPFKIGSE